jgi:CRISPR system Cascade subunit CasD
MQSWGGTAQFSQRPTGPVPSKSAIVGLLAAAQGRKRGSDVSDIAELQMTVRVDRGGQLLRDYHTVGARYPKGERLRNAEGKERTDALVTERYYLADAAFTVALAGDAVIVASLDDALRNPRWALALGRRSCPPAEPFHLGIVDVDPVALLETRLPVVRVNSNNDFIVRFIADDPAGMPSSVRDQPGRVLNRWDDYRTRTTRTWSVDMEAERFTKEAFDLIESLRAA